MNSANVSPTRSLKRLSPRSPRPCLLDPWLEFNAADLVLTETPAPWFPWHITLFAFFLSLSAKSSHWPSLQTPLFVSASLRLLLGESLSPFSSACFLGCSAMPTADVVIHTLKTLCSELHTHWGHNIWVWKCCGMSPAWNVHKWSHVVEQWYSNILASVLAAIESL